MHRHVRSWRPGLRAAARRVLRHARARPPDAARRDDRQRQRARRRANAVGDWHVL